MRTQLALLGAITLAAGAAATPAMAAGNPGGAKGRKVVAHAVQRPGQALGAAPQTSGTSFIVTFKLRDEAGAESFVKAVSDPSSPQHGKYLNPAQFTSRFAASQTDVSRALAWLRSQGLNPGAVSPTRSYVQVTGAVSAVNKAFSTSIRSYRSAGRTYTAPASSVTVPNDVGAVISGVVGLDRSKTLTTSNARSDETGQKKAAGSVSALGAKPGGKSARSDACSSYYGQYTLPNIPDAKSPLTGTQPGAMCGYTPQQMRAARGIDKVKQTGKGRSVGITLWCNDPRIADDTNTWAKDLGFQKLRNGQLQVIAPAGGYDPQYCDDKDSGGVNGEQALDVQSIHGAAPDANIVYAAAARPFDDALLASLHTLVDGNKVDAISNSWGGGETNDPATNDAYSSVFMQAAAQGISVLFSSGDDGDNTGGDQATTPPSPDYPAANPWITAVGGTSLATGNASGSKVSWEQAWNTSRSVLKDDAWGPWTYRYGGGGGVSQYHPEPYYQKGVVPTRFTGVDPHRAYPDLAGAGDPYTGYLIGFHDGEAASGNFGLTKIGGTSWSSPWTAGTVVLAGKRVGFLNPAIYGAGHAGLSDIAGNGLTHGFEVKTTIVPKSGAPYTALTTVGVNSQEVQNQTLTSEPGYDNLTGFGVPASTRAFLSGISR
ncbi:S8/S53 family peptidase [Flexivirga sp. ID2601S]|uniref:S8/S53 family peptidase n=1 Tax=Flexivirga aerilata TaxID=1656889 RepID=A0A849ARG4_9MICO|nr:S53 family peptidase [Flexivirga aerilata]NNG39352.1 S8/S53 family peptidase [Flexivirga aerilata]